MKKPDNHPYNRQKGFTLIELSIVLVIIGLIIGGILVGQDLIKAAEVRGTLTQIEKYNSAVNTFRTKFNGIPGDIEAQNAAGFQLFTFTSPGPGLGDGNGLIEGGSANSVIPEGETLVFWRHLSEANLVDGSFGINGNSAIDATTGKTATALSDPSGVLPVAQLGRGNFIIVYGDTGYNYYQVITVNGITTDPAYTFGSVSVTPIEAYDMDAKVDDGLPNSGVVNARGITAADVVPTYFAGAQANTCINGTSATEPAAAYNLSILKGGTDPSCSVRFRFN